MTYSHIMDPRTGRPVQDVLSVAVLARTGTAGDALDNAFFVQGVERQPDVPGAASRSTEAYFFLPARRGWRMGVYRQLVAPGSSCDSAGEVDHARRSSARGIVNSVAAVDDRVLLERHAPGPAT